MKEKTKSEIANRMKADFTLQNVWMTGEDTFTFSKKVGEEKKLESFTRKQILTEQPVSKVKDAQNGADSVKVEKIKEKKK